MRCPASFSRLLVLAAAALAAAGPAVFADETPAVLKTLRKGHPRLYATADDFARLKQAIPTDPRLMEWFKREQSGAKKILSEPPVEHVLIGPRLLDKSRRALDRITCLAGLYRMDGDTAKRDRAIKEMHTIAAFPDWNPSHFLDTAEMTNALATGYDWLYDDLSPADRKTFRQAIIKLGLEPGLKIYRSGRGWSSNQNNWNQVCNGGLVAGALAIAEDEPAVAAEVVDFSRKSIVNSMKSFAPDGGWEEGPGYWGYATKYNVIYLAAVQSALGTDFGLNAIPGFSEAGQFRMHAVGPIGKTFNYADAGEGAGATPQMLWLARTFHRPEYAEHELSVMGSRSSFEHLLYSAGTLPKAGFSGVPLDAVFRRVNVATFRSAWGDPKALFVGFKGGDNTAAHGHLDLGSFVVDALGQRWVTDIGPDDYNLPNYFGKNRWDYFRLRTESHNTLTFDGDNQETKAKAPLVAYSGNAGSEAPFAVADLSAGYPKHVGKALRGIRLTDDRKAVLIQDELDVTSPGLLRSTLMTPAKVTIAQDGRSATLTIEGQTLTARIVEAPADAVFVAESAQAPEPQRANRGLTRLVLKLTPKLGPVRLAVRLEPQQGVRATLAPVVPLATWIQGHELPAWTRDARPSKPRTQ
jgi:hypothetical protein